MAQEINLEIFNFHTLSLQFPAPLGKKRYVTSSQVPATKETERTLNAIRFPTLCV
jgi:hypothetical protein